MTAASPHPLRVARLQADLSQEEVAYRAGVSVKTVARIEHGGNASRRTRRALSEALGIDPTALQREAA